LNQELEIAYETTLEGWARALELRDKETEGHSRRVTDLTIKIAKIFDFDENAIRYVYYGAILHDVGKMGIPDEILNKPGALTLKEREIINQHPTYAFEMLKDIKYLQPAISIPYSHHENWDGTGYPQKLQGEEIPLSARIFSVIDNWDALTSDRPYREAWSKEKTIEYLKEQSGKKFDPKVVEVFLNEIIKVAGLLKDAR
jgi:putative nucleotidyltransferase with HDIG domain